MSHTTAATATALQTLLVVAVMLSPHGMQPVAASGGGADPEGFRNRQGGRYGGYRPYRPPPRPQRPVTCKQLQATTTSALTKIIHPTSANITLSGQVPPEFSVNASGRIVPVGTFQGGLGALEYFYRLAGPLTEDPTATRVTAISIKWMICNEEKRQVAFEVVFLFETPALGAIASYNLSAVGIFVFNKQGKVCSYDWTIRRLDFLTETTERKLAGLLGLTLEQFHVVININTACTTTQTYCTGNLTQFTTKEECVGFLRDELPYGTWDLADQNNAVCRILHSILVPVRPHVHCAHVGRYAGLRTDRPSLTRSGQPESPAVMQQLE